MGSMSYAGARLRLGIAGVGSIVVMTAIAFAYQLPSTFFPFYGGPWYADWAALAVFYLIYALISMPFDFLGGYLLPCRFHRLCLPFPIFMLKWMRGVLVQGVVMTSAGMAVLQAGKMEGYWGAVAAVAVIQLILLWLQAPLAALAGALERAENAPAQAAWADSSRAAGGRLPQAITFESLDPGFSGGYSGLPGLSRLILPRHWTRLLSAEALSAELLRRAGVLATGARTRGVLLAMGWNLAGFMISAAMPWVRLDTVFGVIQVTLGCTLWSFLGLLALPSFSRPAVIEADRWALEHGATPASLLLAMTEIDQMQEDEPSRSKWIERIFHPVPSIENRLKAIETGHKPAGAWQAARLALYLSWAHFGLLSRAVHCNSGRPELWVILPGD